ncbi:glycoside hydrolase family 2 protein [Olivibacter domesticus]|uniref:Beta-galactosidase n=1 Tax=Olivibacter domesticus TaxID=407022 RepID=A0A1H7QFB3_OLID1|nr:glycoside hydrolase family 2 TIM barrel-domain containing protein [Olivibacter domesticus]SEL46682.1 beta-galactosidase [Olivibacter domesticus]
MVIFKYYLLYTFFLIGTFCTSQGQQASRIDKKWEFLKSDLGGIWEAVRPVGKGDPESVPLWETVDLPHCFNATDAVDPDVNYYQGPGWYRKNLSIENPYNKGRTLLHFEGAGQKTAVYVYTTKVGEHVGGYDEWTIDITDAVKAFKETSICKEQFKGEVPISIRADNSRDLEMIPSDLADFNLYGGIYRHLNLQYIPALSIDKVFAHTEVDEKGKEGKIAIKTRLLNHTSEKIGKLSVKLLDPKGREVANLEETPSISASEINIEALLVKKPQLWSPDKPDLYTLVLTLNNADEPYVSTTKIGFRHFEFKEKGPFLLNGKRLLLRGTHRHEDHAGVGAAMSDAMILKEMDMMKQMGVNFIRLGHYQQSRVVLNACDSLGILVWEEIPWCRGGIGGDVYKEQARRMLTNMIEQHYNHPAIIIWGLGNENDWPGDFSVFDKEKIRDFMMELNDLSHQLDSSRKTAIRRCDFCKDIVDVYSPSIWAGWYRGLYTDYKQSSEDEMKKVNHFLHVEWGGDSHARRHAENPDKILAEVTGGKGTDERSGDASLFGGAARVSKDGDWSESYICNLIDWHLKEQETMPWLTGSAYWPFKDFSTPVRPDNPVPYVNQKGVVERNLNKKEAYYVFQSYWTNTPMVHIYGHSWPIRWGEKEEEKMIKVYSNAEEVTLIVNGENYGTKKRNSQDFPAAGLRWMVKLKEGTNQIKAMTKIGGKVLTDEINQVYQTAKWGKPQKMIFEKIHQQDDVATIQVSFLDAKGVKCLDAQNWVNFSAAGDGILIADQGTSDGSRKVQAYNGRAIIKVKLTGNKCVVSAKSDELKTAFVMLE